MFQVRHLLSVPQQRGALRRNELDRDDDRYDNLCEIISTHSSVRDQLREAVSDLVRIGFEPIHAAALRCGAPSSLTRPSKRHLSDLSRQYRMKLAAIVAPDIDEGCLEPREIRLVTNTIINASQSIFRWIKPDGPIPPEEFIREVPAMVLRGIFATPAGQPART